jgi:glutamine amidotransferase
LSGVDSVITVVDYGMGNRGSIMNMLKKVGARAEVTSDESRIRSASKLIIPGVGAFDAGMRNLRALGLVAPLEEAVLSRRVPTLGICLGMQLMTRRSEEGAADGFGWIDAEVRRFTSSDVGRLKVPHMGWNVVHPVRDSALIGLSSEEQRFYFVHSYYVCCATPADVLLRCTYGIEFTAGFQHDNVMGVQFHPEKSHKFGMRLLSNFVEFC